MVRYLLNSAISRTCSPCTSADNQLSGQIPQELGNLPNLLYLGLSGNRLSGCVPDGHVWATDFGDLGLSFCGGG